MTTRPSDFSLPFSANLGFLWTEHALPDAIRAAAAAGFGAVECHWPYDVDAAEIKQVLAETGLPMLGLNTRRGDVAAGDNGVCAIPGREAEARAVIDEAIGYAGAIGCRNVHVMAGKTAVDSASTACFVENLKYAADKADAAGCGLLIEPLNTRDAAGYFLTSLEQAADILDKVGRPSVKIMFDCYHIQIMQGDLVMRARAFADMIGHIQFAGVPDRGEPDKSEIDYSFVLPQLCEDGYDSFLGAEYRPRTTTDAGLGWMERFRR